MRRIHFQKNFRDFVWLIGLNSPYDQGRWNFKLEGDHQPKNGEALSLNQRGLLGCIAAAAILVANAYAQEEALRYNLSIDERTLGSALDELARISGAQLIYPDYLAPMSGVPPVIGHLTVDEALDILLRGTGISGGLSKSGVIVIALGNGNAQDREDQMASGNVKTGLLASASALMFGVGGVATAQDESPEAREGGRDTIIVTAQKREQNIQDVPISIAAIGSEEIADRGIVSLQDLAGAVPGLTVQQGSNLTRPTIRGVGGGGGFSAAQIGFYLDDISVAGNPAYALDLRAYDLERIEVLRGPQGTLFGDGSVGGAIRYITKKPEMNVFTARADLEVAGTQDGAPSFETRGVVNVPLIEDKLALRVVGTFDHDGGWIDLPDPQGGIDRQNINSSDVVNIRTNLLWKISENLEATGLFLFHRNDGNLTVGEDANGDAVSPFGFTGDRFRKDDYELYALTLKYDLGFAELTSASSYVDARLDFLLASAFFPAEPPEAAPVLPVFVVGDVDRQVFNQEVRLVSTDSSRLNWLIGGHYRDRRIDQASFGRSGPFDGPLPPAPTAPSFNSTDKTESFALFGEVSYNILDWLEIGGGLRYFEDDRSLLTFTTLGEAKFDALTGRAFIKASVTENLNLYASYSEGFRSGGINPVGRPPFDPEKLKAYEIGAKGSFLDGRVDAEFAFYYNDFSNSQIFGLDPDILLTLTSNGGDVEVFGGEAVVSAQITDRFRLDVSGSYIDSEFVAIDVITFGGLDVGDPLPLAAPYNFNISPVYEFEWRGMTGFVRADYHQAGRSTAYIFSESQSDVINMFNANIELDVSENVSVGLFGSNLLNDRGYVDGFAYQSTNVRSRPRTIGARLRISN